MGWKTEFKTTVADETLPTTCKMKRPESDAGLNIGYNFYLGHVIGAPTAIGAAGDGRLTSVDGDPRQHLGRGEPHRQLHDLRDGVCGSPYLTARDAQRPYR